MQRALVLVGAVGLGLLLQQVLGAHLASIQGLAEHDLGAARRELAQVFRVGGSLLFGLTTLLGAALLLGSRRALREQRFPPSGLLSWGSPRVVEGPRAQSLARVGAVLSALLVVCSLAGGALAWEMAARLIACPVR